MTCRLRQHIEVVSPCRINILVKYWMSNFIEDQNFRVNFKIKNNNSELNKGTDQSYRFKKREILISVLGILVKDLKVMFRIKRTKNDV